MPVTVSQIRAGLVANLESMITDVQISPYVLANPTPPAIHVFPGGPAGEITYDRAMRRGLDIWPFTIQAFVGLTSDIGAQIALDEFIDPASGRSVKAAVETDPTLGGIVHTLHVTECTGEQVYMTEGRVAVLGSEWHVLIYAKGN